MDKHNSVVLELDRPRELVLTHRVLKRFCGKHKISLSHIGEAIDDYDMMTDLLLEMLRSDDPGLKADDLDTMLDKVPIKRIIRAITDALTESIGEDSSGEV